MNRLVVLVASLSVFAFGCGSSPSAPSEDAAATSTFTVPLSSANEVPAVTNADAGGSGTATITLAVERDSYGIITSATMKFEISVTGFPAGTTVTDAHIHNGSPGSSAGVYVATTLTSGELSLANGAGSITKSGINVPADRAAAILANPAGHYFNVHTALNPAGAIRGQLSGPTPY
jgi:hypothetical protein